MALPLMQKEIFQIPVGADTALLKFAAIVFDSLQKLYAI